MLELRFLRENADLVRTATARRGIDVDFDRILELDRSLLTLRQERDETRAEQKRLSSSFPQLEGDAKAAAGKRAKELGQSVKAFEEKIREGETALNPLLLEVPNIADPEVPDGLTAAENVEVRKWGEKPEFDFEIKDHLDLGVAAGLIDMKRAVRLAGSRTYFLRGDLVLLELALMRYALDLIHSRGYVPHSPPLIVNRGAMEGTGYLPTGADQAYECTRDDGWLIGTSEVPVTSIHGGEILDGRDLPLRYAGHSVCFRREAGTHGKDTRGLYRVHQFMKVEQVVVGPNDPELSRKLHEEILGNAEDVLKALALPYRVMALSAGDMGRSAALTYDIETWMPGRGAYGETHSASRYYDYQARRLGIRYRDAANKARICHTLNNTVLASPRILVAVMENYQQADGSIRVPEAIVSLVGKERLGTA